jgi:CRP/FNR family transcriptional regulator, cyclic AMP receptor protein
MSDEIKYAYLKSHPLFANTGEQKIKEVCNLVKVKTVSRGETLNYGAGDYSKIYLLIKGKIKITECDTMDNELIKDILTAPDIFGDLGLDGYPCCDEFAEALTANTVLCIFNSAEFKKILGESSMIALSYANTVNNKLKKLEGRHSDLVFRDAKSRLIRFIKTWALSDGSLIGDKIILNNYLTHSDIAGVISTSRQSVNVLLNELRDSGMLFYNRKKIELNNPVAWN